MQARAFCLALVGLAVAASLAPAGEAEKARLLAEYPAAAKRLQDRYAQVKGSLTVTENTPPGAAETRTSRITFAVDGGRHKAERRATRQAAGGEPRESTAVFGFGPDDGFTLFRPAPDAPFAMVGRDPAEARGDFHSECGNHLFASFQYLGTALTSYLDRLELEAVEPLPAADGGGLRVTLRKRNGYPLRFDVDPDRGWVIRRVEHPVIPSQGDFIGPRKRPMDVVLTIDYQGEDPATGLPLPKTIRQHRMGRLASTATIDEIRFEPTPAAEFTLAHYGVAAPAP
jgi:hypothetical protein